MFNIKFNIKNKLMSKKNYTKRGLRVKKCNTEIKITILYNHIDIERNEKKYGRKCVHYCYIIKS